MDTLLFCIYRHRKCPAPHMFRYLKDPACCLGSERIAKRVLACMEAGGVNRQVFKAHCLRGATATHLLKLGVQADVVRARGGLEHDKNVGHLLFPPPPVSRLASAALGGKFGRQAIYYVSRARSAGLPKRSRSRKAK